MTTETFWFELVRTLATTVTAAAAVAGLVIAAHGLNKWQAETAGKLRIELAEGVLADFYEARDIIQAARSPLTVRSPLNLGSERPVADIYDNSIEAASRVSKRLEDKSDFFSKLYSRRYRFVAHFGKEATKPYEELRHVHDEIIAASRLLASIAQGPWTGDPKVPVQWMAMIRSDPNKEDQIAKRLDAAIAQIEQTCGPIIQTGVKPSF